MSAVNFQENILLAPFTTFKIGGPARYFFITQGKDALFSALERARDVKLPIFILGGGSNILISDKGFPGLVIKNKIIGIDILKDNEQSDKENIVLEVAAGESLARLVSFALKNSFSGLEWAAGIPGTVGGAIRGNAGAFGKAVADMILEVEAYDVLSRKKVNLENQECSFKYRHSIFKENSNMVILSVKIRLKKGQQDVIRNKMIENIKIRAKSEYGIKNSAGSFFKNIEWEKVDKEKLRITLPELKNIENKYKLPAGFLIQMAGFSGRRIGDAQIHPGHCNYIININYAKAEDVKALADLCAKAVFEKYGVNLEPEVQFVGF